MAQRLPEEGPTSGPNPLALGAARAAAVGAVAYGVADGIGLPSDKAVVVGGAAAAVDGAAGAAGAIRRRMRGTPSRSEVEAWRGVREYMILIDKRIKEESTPEDVSEYIARISEYQRRIDAFQDDGASAALTSPIRTPLTQPLRIRLSRPRETASDGARRPDARCTPSGCHSGGSCPWCLSTWASTLPPGQRRWDRWELSR